MSIYPDNGGCVVFKGKRGVLWIHGFKNFGEWIFVCANRGNRCIKNGKQCWKNGGNAMQIVDSARIMNSKLWHKNSLHSWPWWRINLFNRKEKRKNNSPKLEQWQHKRLIYSKTTEFEKFAMEDQLLKASKTNCVLKCHCVVVWLCNKTTEWHRNCLNKY